MAAEKLENPKIGILKIMKDHEGEFAVGGVRVKGGASTMTSGA